jgi:hypothetical protein
MDSSFTARTEVRTEDTLPRRLLRWALRSSPFLFAHCRDHFVFLTEPALRTACEQLVSEGKLTSEGRRLCTYTLSEAGRREAEALNASETSVSPQPPSPNIQTKPKPIKPQQSKPQAQASKPPVTQVKPPAQSAPLLTNIPPQPSMPTATTTSQQITSTKISKPDLPKKSTKRPIVWEDAEASENAPPAKNMIKENEQQPQKKMKIVDIVLPKAQIPPAQSVEQVDSDLQQSILALLDNEFKSTHEIERERFISDAALALKTSENSIEKALPVLDKENKIFISGNSIFAI